MQNLWIPAFAGMTSEILGMTSEILGMTSEILGMTSEILGMTSEILGMTSEILIHLFAVLRRRGMFLWWRTTCLIFIISLSAFLNFSLPALCVCLLLLRISLA